jgi:hypothetical protein
LWLGPAALGIMMLAIKVSGMLQRSHGGFGDADAVYCYV